MMLPATVKRKHVPARTVGDDLDGWIGDGRVMPPLSMPKEKNTKNSTLVFHQRRRWVETNKLIGVTFLECYS